MTQSYSQGTLSVDHGGTTVTFVGAMDLTAVVKIGDIIHAWISQGGSPEIFRSEVIGIIDDLDTTTCAIPTYKGETLAGVDFFIEKGIGWLSGAGQVSNFVTLMTELAGLGLAGISSGTPDNADGARNNTIKFDTVNGLLYQKIAGSYQIVSSSFANGIPWVNTTGSPNGRDAYDEQIANFMVGSIDEGGVYIKVTSTPGDWSDLISLKGQKGDTGDRGTIAINSVTTGAPGTEAAVTNVGTANDALLDITIPRGDTGATILTGAGAPDDGNGANGDLYINTSNGDYYKKTAGSWGTATGNLMGPQGNTGRQPYAGSPDPTGALGVDGDVYIQTGTGLTGGKGDVWTKDAGTWSITGNIRGAPGAGTGDMLADTYDPNGVNGDAFDMGNMVEAADAKIMTGAERTRLSAATLRQVRSWLAANGGSPAYIWAVDHAVSGKITNAVNIQWLHGSIMVSGDPLYNLIKATLGFTSGEMATAYTEMLAYAV